jgi:acyl-CoA thioesterase I
MDTLSRLSLYVLLSGHAFFVGLTFVAASVLLGRRWPVLTGTLLWTGLALAPLSATPLHPGAYAILVVSVIGWLLARRKASRVRHPVAGAVLAVICVLFVAELADRGFSETTLDTNHPIVVIGDSLSAGLGSSREGTWPSLLAARHALRVTNLAQAGATLRSGLSQIRGMPPGPATVLVELGGNDVLGGIGAQQFAVDLRSLLATVTTQERSVLMFELPLLPFQNSYGRVQRRLCREYGVRLIPRSVLAGAVTLPGHTTDGLHLSPAGHAWLAAEVCARLRARGEAGQAPAPRPGTLVPR